MVLRTECHLAVAHTCADRPGLGQIPLRLQVLVVVAGQVVFVAAQGPFNALGGIGPRGAREVLVATAVLVHLVESQASRDGQWPGRQQRAPGQPGIHPAEGAVQVDDAAGAGGRHLRRVGDGLELCHLPLAGVAHHPHFTEAQRLLVDHAQLAVGDVLAGVVGQSIGARLGAALVHLGPRQTQGVLHLWHVQVAAHQGHA